MLHQMKIALRVTYSEHWRSFRFLPRSARHVSLFFRSSSTLACFVIGLQRLRQERRIALKQAESSIVMTHKL
jgi:hypothetical protein